MKGLAARNVGSLFTSLVVTSFITVFPQYYFNLKSHDTRSIYLSLSLFLSAGFAIAGVRAARKIRLGQHSRRNGAGLCALVTLLSLVGGSDWIASPVLFVVNQCVLFFAVNYLKQEMDERSTSLAGSAMRNENNLMINAFRFLGMLLGPLLFSFVQPGTWASSGILLGFASLASLSIFVLTADKFNDVFKAPPAAQEQVMSGEPLAERILGLTSLWIYASYYVLAASITYILNDLQKFSDAGTRGPRLIAIVYASALVGTLLVKFTGFKPRLSWMLVAPVSLFFAGFYIPRDIGRLEFVLAAGSILLGLGFGFFLIAYRDHMSHRMMKERRPDLLARYNNLSNISSIAGYIMMFGLANADSLLTSGFAVHVCAFLTFISVVLLLAMIVVLAAGRPKELAIT